MPCHHTLLPTQRGWEGWPSETFSCLFSKQLCKACGVSDTAPSGLGTQQVTKQMQSWPS